MHFYSSSPALPESANSSHPAPSPNPMTRALLPVLVLLYFSATYLTFSASCWLQDLSDASYLLVCSLHVICPSYLSSPTLVVQLPGPWGLITSALTSPTKYHVPDRTSLSFQNNRHNNLQWKKKKSDHGCFWGWGGNQLGIGTRELFKDYGYGHIDRNLMCKDICICQKRSNFN